MLPLTTWNNCEKPGECRLCWLWRLATCLAAVGQHHYQTSLSTGRRRRRRRTLHICWGHRQATWSSSSSCTTSSSSSSLALLDMRFVCWLEWVCVHIVSVCVCTYSVHTPLGAGCTRLCLSISVCVSVLTALQSTVYSNWIFARDFRSLNPTAKSRKAATTTTAMATTTTNDGAEQRL